MSDVRDLVFGPCQTCFRPICQCPTTQAPPPRQEGMEWELVCDPLGGRRLHVKWNEMDLIHLRLDPFDFALLHECDSSSKLSDKLLALELLARKYERAQEAP